MSTGNRIERTRRRHAACDECRSRKLKCPGEKPCCARCRQDGVECTYSISKPMGRPTKRSRTMTIANQCGDKTTSSADSGDQFPIAAMSSDNFESSWLQNADWSVALPPTNTVARPTTTDPLSLLSLEGGFQSDAVLSSDMPACACLSSLYLTLSTLQTMKPPLCFPSSLKPLRSAQQAAADILNCSSCPTTFLTGLHNTQLVGTLLISIGERYGKLLEAIDQEALLAETAGDTKKFCLADCETDARVQETAGPFQPTAGLAVFETELSPREWRSLAKKVVQAEVYGPPEDKLTATCGLPFVAVIQRMEQRQRYYHEHMTHVVVDAREETARTSGCSWDSTPKEEHLCLKLCSFARKLVDRLDWS